MLKTTFFSFFKTVSFSIVYRLHNFQSLPEDICTEERNILRENGDEYDGGENSEALELAMSKIPAKKPRGQPVKEGKGKDKSQTILE